MDQYKQVAVSAVRLLADGKASEPREAWEHAAKTIFPSSLSLQNKGCPRGAFLGLCSQGVVVGIPAGTYGKANKNGQYAVSAAQCLAHNRFLVSQPALLWKKVAGAGKSENSQMDVVIGLWEAGLIAMHAVT